MKMYKVNKNNRIILYKLVLKNKTIKSTDLNYIMLYAAARYSAHVGKNVLETDNHEDYVKHMSEQFIDMIREHLADPNL